MEAVFAGKEKQEIIYHEKACCCVMKNEKLRYELESYSDQGIQLLLNGRKSTPKRIAKAYKIAEEGEYMRDYIQDENGKLRSLSFDFVKEEEKI